MSEWVLRQTLKERTAWDTVTTIRLYRHRATRVEREIVEHWRQGFAGFYTERTEARYYAPGDENGYPTFGEARCAALAERMG